MYAIIETGSKQYRVSEGDLIEIERLAIEPGKEVVFDRVFMIGGEGEVQIGTPTLKAKVLGTMMGEEKGKKVISFRYRKRKGYKRKVGHRQWASQVKITKIQG